MKLQHLIPILFLAAFCTVSAQTNIPTSVSQPNLMESLVSANSRARLSAVKELLVQRRQVVKQLMAILDSTNSDDVKMDAVVVLGDYRAEEAISFLIDHLDWEIKVDRSTANDIGAQMIDFTDYVIEKPVSGALEEIGLPAIRALLGRIVETDDTKIIKQCVQICYYIEGPEMTKQRLEDLLKMNDEKRKRLRIISALADEEEIVASRTMNYTVAIPTNFDNFAKLPITNKNAIVWELHNGGMPGYSWGMPNQKPVCRDLLLNDGYSSLPDNANAGNWLVDAIDMAEKQGWTDLNPLIEKIYEQPRGMGLFERAFRYFRVQSGKPISTNLLAAVHKLYSGGQHNYSEPGESFYVSDEQLAAAKRYLLQEPDKKAVLVYLLEYAGGNGGKGANDRGHKAIADVLGSLDRDTVIKQVRQDAPSGMGGRSLYLEQRYLDWVTNNLGSPQKSGNP